MSLHVARRPSDIGPFDWDEQAQKEFQEVCENNAQQTEKSYAASRYDSVVVCAGTLHAIIIAEHVPVEIKHRCADMLLEYIGSELKRVSHG